MAAQHEAALHTLRPAARAQAQVADTTLALRTRTVPRGRVDAATGVLRAAYRIEAPAYAGPPERAARAYLREAAPAYGLTRPAEDLRLEDVRQTPYSSHVTFQQTLRDVPVYGRHVRVNLDAQGRPTLVLSGYAEHLEAHALSFDPRPSLSVDAARERARTLFATEVQTGTPDLVVYPSDPPRLAWRLHAWTPGTPADWEILLDAHTGGLLLMENRMLYVGKGERGRGNVGGWEDERIDEDDRQRNGEAERRGDGGQGAHSGPAEQHRANSYGIVIPRSLRRGIPHAATGRDAESPFFPDELGRAVGTTASMRYFYGVPRWPGESVTASNATSPLLLSLSPSLLFPVSQTDGAGLVFDPDPLTSAGAVYGDPGFVDGDDADTPQLDAQRVAVTLPGLTQGSDGLYRLEGPYVRIIGDGAGVGFLRYTPPAEASPDAFAYTRSDDGFEAVMAYYHVDLSQRYAQTLDVGRPIQEAPIRVNPQAFSNDQSGYVPSQNVLGFGTGGIDDAEDADVLWHEYGHALLEASAASLAVTREGEALHEGWSDYWAASRSRYQIETGVVPERDWRHLYQWDGNELWAGRVLDAAGRYPETTRCDDFSGCDIYADGLFWATAMMDVYTALGRTLTDRLHLAALGYLSAPVTFRDAGEAVVQADIDLYDGAHVTTLLDVLEPWGLVDPERYGPVLAHEPLPATEDLDGTVHVEVDAAPVVADVERVHLIYHTGDAESDTLSLQPEGGDRYAAVLDLPAEPDTVSYYLEAVDAEGRRTLRPAGAPTETFRFAVGPDHVSPSIEHVPPPEASMQTWPLVLDAEVHDDLGVDSVGAAYIVVGPDSAVADSGRFELNAGSDARYRGAFPTPVGRLQQGSVVRYRLYARDAARAGNRTTTDWYAVPVTAEGILRTYNFETDDDLTSSGAWARGEPAYGLRIARSGRRVWATFPGGAYADTPGHSSLALPPLNLTGLDAVYLVFWHWYDTEYSVTPDTLIWDGGNVKASIDGGSTWQVLVPEGGYGGRLAQGRLNPMGGEPAFGGYSHGWRRVVVPLPDTADVRLRFDFGTDERDEGQTVFTRAGWHLDDVMVTTRLPDDLAPPQVVTPPPPVTLRTPQQRLTLLTVEVGDDQGVTDVFVDYEGFEQGTVRLAMHPADRAIYGGRLEPLAEPSFSDSLTYRVRVRDAAGKETVYPAPGEAPLLIRFRHVDTPALLEEARPSGLWTDETPGWRIRSEADAPAVSSLVLAPLTLPSNAETLELTLEHRHVLGDSLGGNVKLTTDGGATWQVLEPEGGYDDSLHVPDDHPMQGEPIFSGGDGQPRSARFDLTPYAGEHVQLRLDLAAPRPLAATEHWSVEQAGLVLATRDEQFEAPLTFDLATPYPNPARTFATLHYTLPTEVDGRDVRLEVYDVLGRRVAVPVDERQAAGPHTVTFDLDGWAASTYFLRLTAGSHSATTRLVVLR